MSAELPSPEPATSARTRSRASAGMSPSRCAPTLDATTAASAGDCSAGVTYVDDSGHSQASIVSEEQARGARRRMFSAALRSARAGRTILSVSCGIADGMLPN